MEVFGLEPLNKKTSAPGYHLTDGRVMLSLMPWSIPVFEGMSIKRPGPDHFGFKVESVDALKQTIADVIGGCSYLAPMPMGGAKESDVRKAMFARSASKCAWRVDLLGMMYCASANIVISARRPLLEPRSSKSRNCCQ